VEKRTSGSIPKDYTGMTKCKKCGTESLVVRQQFCHRCGGSLVPPVPSSHEIANVGLPLIGIGVSPFEVTKIIKSIVSRERGDDQNDNTSYNRQLVERIVEASKQSEDDTQSPAVALTTNRLAAIQTFLVQAQYYWDGGDIEAAFGRLDGAWRMLPNSVRQRFPLKPSMMLAELVSRPHHFELLQVKDIFGYDAVQNPKLRREYEEERLDHIATDLFDEITTSYWAELEKQGYDIPKSGRFSLEKAIAKAHEADEALESNSE
jgi:hypothetical protein